MKNKIGDFFKYKFNPFFMRDNKKNIKISAIILASLIVVTSAIAAIYIYKKMTILPPSSPGIDFDNKDDTAIYNDPDLEAMNDVLDGNSIDSELKAWATNGGEKYYSKNVTNILLCGTDSRVGDGGRSDAMILVSINDKTKKITVTSFLRDSYTYMNIDGEDRYNKINSVHNWGGPGTLLKVIEDDYKIKIDGYASVGFESFPKLIDALGGVKLDVKEYEARYIDNNRTGFESYTPERDFPYGDGVKLSGNEALVYSRIRHSDSDSDLSRVKRQRAVIISILTSAKNASISQLNNAVNATFPFLKTNYEQTTVLNLGLKAFTRKWMDYEIIQMTVPDTTSGGTGKSATVKGSFVWIIDYPKAAHDLQMALYGNSNISLSENRETIFRFIGMKSSSGSSKNNNSSGSGSNKSGNNGKDDPSSPNYNPSEYNSGNNPSEYNSNNNGNNSTNPNNGGGGNESTTKSSGGKQTTTKKNDNTGTTKSGGNVKPGTSDIGVDIGDTV